VNNWRNTILQEFVPNVTKLTLVSDPDCLLTEEKLAMELRERGFDLIEFNDSIEFRYAYESKYRSIWDRGEQTNLVVILRLQETGLEFLPFDLFQAGRKLSFSLGDLFPNMSYPVVELLDRSLLDLLFDAQKKTSTDRMGDNATKDFILRHVFSVAAEPISTEVELLRSLLRIHYGNTIIPPVLTARLVEVLENSRNFKDWPLKKIVPDAEQFFTFIQERWPIFLESLQHTGQAKENSSTYGLKIEGPTNLPFDHHDIRVYVDNLFIEGKLIPVSFSYSEIEKNSWISSGILVSKDDSEELRISRLFELIKASQLSLQSRYTDWITFSMKWAELSALIHREQSGHYKQQYQKIGNMFNGLFADWLETHYASLINLPPSNPVMLHHVPRRLARDLEDQTNNRIALVVIDGLSLDQWVTVRNILQTQNSKIVMRETAVFAWIPTLTSVSRQSIFSGKPPIYFPSSIHSTNNEEKLWKQFWQGQGVSKLDVAYKRGLGDGDVEAILDNLINPSQTKVVGLVVDKVDKIMHGMQLGSVGMHNQIAQWCEGQY